MKPGIPHTTTALALQIDEQAKFHLPGTHNSVQSIIRKLTRLIVGPVKYRKDLIQYSLSETAEPKLGLFERDRSCDFLFHPDLLKKTSEHLSHDQNPNYSELLGNVDSLFKKLENEADEILRSLDKCFNLDLYKKMESLPERKRKLMRMVLYEPNRPIFIPEHFDHSGLTFQVARKCGRDSCSCRSSGRNCY